MNIRDFRAQFPQYDDLNDNALASALHKKYYSDIPKQDFDKAFIGQPIHDDLEGAAVKAEDSLQLQNIDATVKPVIVGTRDEILKLKQSGKIPKGRELFLAVPGKAYVIDPDGVQAIYGGSRVGALKRAKMDILKGNDSQLLGYPDRAKGSDTIAVTKQGDILTELPRISDAAKAGNIAYGAEGSAQDGLSKAAQVSQAIRLKIPKKWKELGNDSESEGRNEGQGLGQAAGNEETGQSNGQGEVSDYDIAGYIKKYGVPDQSKGQHLTDEFKLPNHTTFSDQSIYNTPEKPGGHWSQAKDGKWEFAPTQYNLDNVGGLENLSGVFNRNETNKDTGERNSYILYNGKRY